MPSAGKVAVDEVCGRPGVENAVIDGEDKLIELCRAIEEVFLFENKETRSLLSDPRCLPHHALSA